MQRQRGELVPIGDALSGMGGPVKASLMGTNPCLRSMAYSPMLPRR